MLFVAGKNNNNTYEGGLLGFVAVLLSVPIMFLFIFYLPIIFYLVNDASVDPFLCQQLGGTSNSLQKEPQL